MRRKKYPLEPLVRMKKDRVETKTRELGQAISTRETLEKSRERKEADRDIAREGANHVRREERSQLEQGTLKVLDLAREGTWELRVRAEDVKRTRDVDEARTAEAGARGAESRAKANVAEASAEHESVQRHQERWNTEAKKAEEAKEEESLAEAVRPKRES
jgi:flagellar biosynthesis chaperone FliJ